jgi:nucleoside phosphorylase
MTQVDFAIITIRADEFAAVIQRFPSKVHKGTSGRIYGLCQIQTKTGNDCIVALGRSGGQGNDAAQQIANDMINDLNPQMLLVVGIAGGVPSNDFTLGDVIISTRILNFNMSKRYEDGREKFDMTSGIHPVTSNIATNFLLYQEELKGWNDPESITVERPTVDLSQFEADTFKMKIPANADKDVIEWYEELQASIISHFRSPRPPLFETGTIASSNTMIRNIDILVKWLQNARSILAVEMETAGVYQATQGIQQQYPVMAIRGISDIIGLERDYQWTKYACQTAAAFAHRFVTAGIVTPRVTSTVASTPPSFSSPAAEEPALLSEEQSGEQADGTGPINVFINYAEEDEKFKKQLDTHLTPLRRDGTVKLLYNQQAELGQDRDRGIARYINSAQIILLLVSPSFLATERTYDREIVNRIRRQESGDAVRVIPIIVRPVSPGILARTPFYKLQGLPRNGRPIDAWRNADEIWADIAEEIRKVGENLRKREEKR